MPDPSRDRSAYHRAPERIGAGDDVGVAYGSVTYGKLEHPVGDQAATAGSAGRPLHGSLR
jgi:hypothetical protein